MTSGKRGGARFWILAMLITLSAVTYQRLVGPTRPVRGRVEVGAEQVRFRLKRSTDAAGDHLVKIRAENAEVSGLLVYRRTPSEDPWTARPMRREGAFLIAAIPHQPPAGKVSYQIFLSRGPAAGDAMSEGIDKASRGGSDDGPRVTFASVEEAAPPGAVPLLAKGPIVIRYRGHVPVWILIVHAFLMFLGMLWSNRAGLEALRRDGRPFRLALWSLLFLVVGGMLLGPVVQKYSFGEYWTGVPFGWDLTDNKTLIAVVAWILALLLGKRAAARARARGGAFASEPGGDWADPLARHAILGASLVTLVIFCIPHSVLGSELKHPPKP